jgi:hypothetical protein
VYYQLLYRAEASVLQLSTISIIVYERETFKLRITHKTTVASRVPTLSSPSDAHVFL